MLSSSCSRIRRGPAGSKAFKIAYSQFFGFRANARKLNKHTLLWRVLVFVGARWALCISIAVQRPLGTPGFHSMWLSPLPRRF